MEFTVYPKDGGEEFTINFAGLEVDDNGRVIIHNDSRKESRMEFLGIDLIAAIVPDQNLEKPPQNQIIYEVYFNGRAATKVVRVVAGFVDTSDNHHIQFRWAKQREGDPSHYEPSRLIENIYVAKSEVIGVFPSEGLVDRWRYE